MKKSPILNERRDLEFDSRSTVEVFGTGRKDEERPQDRQDEGGKWSEVGDVWVDTDTGSLWRLDDTTMGRFTWRLVNFFDYDEESQIRIRNYVDLDVFTILMKKACGES